MKVRSLEQVVALAERQFLQAMRAAEKDGAKNGLASARYFSSGRYSLAMLRRLNHPYGYGKTTPGGKPRGPVPYGDERFINSQSGKFRSQWRTEMRWSTSARALRPFVVNDSEVAKYLRYGTSKMRSRRIDLLVQERLELVLPELLRRRLSTFQMRPDSALPQPATPA